MPSVVPERPCVACGAAYRPKILSNRARYCSTKCKTRFRVRTKKYPYTPKYYLRDKAAQSHEWKVRKASENAYRREVRAWLANYKLERGCIDCGYNLFACALQLDHTGPKVASISELRSSKQRVLAEIQSGRCVVRCANCHSVKTWCEKTGQEYAPGMAVAKESL